MEGARVLSALGHDERAVHVERRHLPRNKTRPCCSAAARRCNNAPPGFAATRPRNTLCKNPATRRRLAAPQHEAAQAPPQLQRRPSRGGPGPLPGGRVTVESRSSHGRVTVESRLSHGRVTVESRSSHGQVTVESRSSHGRVTRTRVQSGPLFGPGGQTGGLSRYRERGRQSGLIAPSPFLPVVTSAACHRVRHGPGSSGGAGSESPRRRYDVMRACACVRACVRVRT